MKRAQMVNHRRRSRRVVSLAIASAFGAVLGGTAQALSATPTNLIAGPYLLTTAAAMRIYINPAPANNSLPNSSYPAAGVFGDFMGADGIPGNADDALSEYCSASLILGTVQTQTGQPPRSFGLTAGHCVTSSRGNPSWPYGPLVADDYGRLRVSGPGGDVEDSDRVRRHPEYATNVMNGDVGLIRLSKNVAGVAPFDIDRNNPLFGGAPSAVNEIGFGNTNIAGGFPLKRESLFDVASVQAVGQGNGNSFTMNTQTGAQTRHSCSGDSGGPYIRNGLQVGVHSRGSSPARPCDGTQPNQSAMNLTTDYMYNWVDSYTHKTMFWDNLHINGPSGPMALDSFENNAVGYGRTGLSAGWAQANDGSVIHPMLGAITANNSWRFFSSIGTNNAGQPELFVNDGGAQGQGMTMLSDGASVIRKNFILAGGQDYSLLVGQRWNSLGMENDLGIKLPDGTFQWSGLMSSAEGNLDQWSTRTMNIDLTALSGDQTISVYLMSAPEPAAVCLLGGFGLILCRRRRR